MRALLLVLAAALAAALAACSSSARPPDGPPPARAFYYWRTTFALSPAEARALAGGGAARLYLRMFDVVGGRRGGARLVGAVTAPAGPGGEAPATRVPAGVELVPVVFVREAALRRAGDLAALADRVWDEVARRARAIGFAPRELQLDCDWTDGTRDAFFALVAAVRARAGIPLSATIRLHQIKYRERTGVPPVERGMLMFYNMGEFSADADARAIFDAASAARYLGRLADYPIPLDVALPIWSWTLHLRDGAVVDLLQSTDPDELPAVPFLRRTGPDRFTATRSAFLHGALLREGDELKVEVTGPAEALAAARQVAPHLAPPAAGTRRTVALFELSERNLARHDPASLDQLFRALR